ncbi:PAS domain S-box protein [Haloarcula japonica]|uniref:histidine kinase n=1 Tax=Haloarcula japonica (strain ATCC 49778 / DSM 6131 / JCM 7785 / NBRC 101032 / NCIMB 13157 / TR-1) TaxID=1227453 RepID=M0LJV3_HALJT|nr:PAS domain S-box protein [Haloarcula japonica]EMA32709.1 HTR-like protein [Haloarcula japonica DSM 6131]
MSGHGEEISVLHVDDDPDLGDLVAVHLEQTHGDISVCTERSAADGLERLSEQAFDCVVSDHDMPGMDGLEFLKVVREEYEELPFILFTGKGNEEIASDAISAGVTEYLQKGVGTDQYAVLANRIERAVGERRAKSALEESERMLSTLISNLPGMVYRARNEPEWPMQFVSDGAAELIGYSSAAIESGEVSWGTLIKESETERLWETVQTCIAADEPFEVSYQIETADGETRWMWERGRVVGTDDDGVEILEGFITDVTAREERERELANQRAFTEKLIDSVDDMFYVVGPDGSLVRWNDTVQSVTGYTNEELASMGIEALIADSDHDKLWRIFEETLETGYGTIEAGVETADGERLQYEFKGSLIEDERGDMFGIAGIGRDITERKRRERELKEYRTLVENVGDPMYVLDRTGTIEMVNEAMAVHLGYDRSEIIDSEPSRFMPEGDVERGTALIRDLIDDDNRTWAAYEMRTIAADGTVRINEDRVAPLFDEDGNFDGTVGVMRETTERKQRERELERYETIIEAVGDPVYTLDDEGVFTYVNEAIERLTGFEPDELVGEHISTIMAGEDINRGSDLIRTMLSDPTRQNVTFETDIVDQNGEHTPIEIHIALLPAADEEFNGTAGVIRDISDRKEREQQLAEFASVVSHDLRNPLNVVKGRISVARTSGDVSHLEAAESAADRMDELINDLLTLARQGDTVGETTMIDLVSLASQAWIDVETGEATLEKDGTATVEADAARLRTVFENLFRNSVEHGRCADSAAPVTVSVGTTDSGFYVADNGVGIPPEERDDVFERGYTTSTTGTGFGLAIVAEIAQAHGWSVSVTESEGGGTRFEFTTSSEC